MYSLLMSAITFSYNIQTGVGHIQGGGWDIQYLGRDLLGAWMAANRDGFYLAPGETFRGRYAPTSVERI